MVKQFELSDLSPRQQRFMKAIQEAGGPTEYIQMKKSIDKSKAPALKKSKTLKKGGRNHED